MSAKLSVAETLLKRDDNATIHDDNERITTQEFVKYLVDAIPDVFLILNEYRQVVFANDATLKSFGDADIDSILGQRPGEMLACEHAENSTGGCGTTEACKVCGAFNAMTQAQVGKIASEECRIINTKGEALDFRIWATPLDFQGRQLTIFTLKDISNEKRRNILERTFFHDIMNTAGIVYTYAQILQMEPDLAKEIVADIYQVSQRLINEIEAQKNLMAAESGSLGVSPSVFSIESFLNNVAMQYKKHEIAAMKSIVVVKGADTVIETDEALLGRVIGNMVKNALEASQPGDTVTVSYDIQDEHVRFYIHNPAFIPRKSQLQIFQRSFSTKGAGRGIGTYSMRLLSEKYLRGQVSFTSSKLDGTTFMATYPLEYIRRVTFGEIITETLPDAFADDYLPNEFAE